MAVHVLGPIRVTVGARPISLPAGKPLAILALLALSEGRPVAVDRVVTSVWGPDAPASTIRTLQVHISRLRSALVGSGVTVRLDPAGYRIDLGPAQTIDVAEFRDCADRGMLELRNDHHERAADLLARALDAWTGPEPLAEVPEAFFAHQEADRLRAHRREVVVARAEAEIHLGRPPTLVADLAAESDAAPYDEHLHKILATAMYRSGRPTHALDVIRELVRRLDEDLGLTPAPDVLALEQQILRHSPELAPAPAAAAGNLPSELTSFVGRDEELSGLLAALERGRLVTLTGAGGMGKTRLAVRAAAERSKHYADGAWLAELAPVTDTSLIPGTIAAALGIASKDLTAAAVWEYLANKHLLLVLDNCEHVIDHAADVVQQILRRCPSVTVLATSREPLALYGEQLIRLQPLAVPIVGEHLDDLRTRAAVQLFASRVRLHNSQFDIDTRNAAVIARLCRQVDGTPLALELAAARSRTTALDELANDLDAHLGRLGGHQRGREDRQRSVTDLVAWSYRLLSEAEQVLFRRLSVFVGGWTVAAAAAVGTGITGDPADVLESLIDKSLVEPLPDTARLRMLEPVRQFAAQAADEHGDLQPALEAHAGYFLELAYRAHLVLTGGGDQAFWLDALEADHDNLRRAGTTLLATADDGRALRFARYLERFWQRRCPISEGQVYAESALSRTDASAHPRHRCWAMVTLSVIQTDRGHLREAHATAHSLAKAAAAINDPQLCIMAELLLAEAEVQLPGNMSNAIVRLRGIDERLVPDDLRGRYLAALSYCLAVAEQPDARVVLERRLRESLANSDLQGAGYAHVNLAAIDLTEGRTHSAAEHLAATLDIATQLKAHDLTATAYLNLGLCALLDGFPENARSHYRNALDASTSRLHHTSVVTAILGMAASAADTPDQWVAAAQLHGFIDHYCEDRDVFDPTENRIRVDHRARLAERLGTDFSRWTAAGGALHMDTAVELAMTLEA